MKRSISLRGMTGAVALFALAAIAAVVPVRAASTMPGVGPMPALLDGAYIRFDEMAAGTAVNTQYKWLGILFSTGTLRPHGGAQWLAVDGASLDISLRDTDRATPLAVAALSFDIDAVAGGGRFQVDAYDRSGAAVLSTLATGGTRVQLHASEISTVRVSALGGLRSWGVAALRAGQDVVPQAAKPLTVCSEYASYEAPNTSMTLYLVAPPMAPASALANSLGCAALPALPVPASVSLYAYYVPPVKTCFYYGSVPISNMYVAGGVIAIFFVSPPTGTMSSASSAQGTISATTDASGCLNLTYGNPTVGYVSFQTAVVDLGAY